MNVSPFLLSYFFCIVSYLLNGDAFVVFGGLG